MSPVDGVAWHVRTMESPSMTVWLWGRVINLDSALEEPAKTNKKIN